MQVDVRSDGRLEAIAREAVAAEQSGLDALWVAEAGNDPFLALAIAAEHTERVLLGTGVAIALARSPMTVAQTAWQLNAYSGGRLLLGLGSQVKAHIERRFSMPWSSPAARMREFVLALRATWESWRTEQPLDFRGSFYTLTLMPPVFRPPPCETCAPRVFLAAVGPLMTEVAGEVADGVRLHSFTTERYLREVTLPRLERGLRRSERAREAVEVSYPVMYVTGEDDDQMRASAAATRRQLAFYASTPAYRAVLDLHGWGALQGKLNEMAKRGAWDRIGDLIEDEVLDALAVVGRIDEVAEQIVHRYGTLVDRISLHQPYGTPPGVDLVSPVAHRVRQLIA